MPLCAVDLFMFYSVNRGQRGTHTLCRNRSMSVIRRGLNDRGGLGQRDLGLPAAKACALDHDPEATMAWLTTIPPQFLPASVQSDPDFASLKDRRGLSGAFPYQVS